MRAASQQLPSLQILAARKCVGLTGRGTEFSVTKQQSSVCSRRKSVSVSFESPAHGLPAARLFNCKAATGAEDAGARGRLAWLCVMWFLGSVGSPRSSTGSNAAL